MMHSKNAGAAADIRTASVAQSSTAASPVRRLPGPSADAASRIGIAIARYGVAAILLAIGILKFTAAEANGIRPLIAASPLLSWMYAVWSPNHASWVIGFLEIVAALGIASRALSAKAAVVGSAMAVATFLVTLSFFLTAPGVWDASLGFPFLGGTGQFIVKDIVLLGASVWSLGESLAAVRRDEMRR